jgi:putative Mg2+ transporter-C (MgtC) family protein
MTDTEIVRRLLLAAVVGGVIGAERELRRKSAGFRTNILITMGSAVFTMMSIILPQAHGGDPARIASQIVTGIGFLGAGAILRTRGGIHGMTTAATVWVNAALGVAAGAGEYHLAVIGGAITLAVLMVLEPVERAFEERIAEGSKTGKGRPPDRQRS